jgi:hypothetical protein
MSPCLGKLGVVLGFCVFIIAAKHLVEYGVVLICL